MDDPGDSGFERGLVGAKLPEQITVPFCRESTLSGIGRTDRCVAVWYARDVTVPAQWDGQRVFLHFGAADYETTVWVNGTEAGQHRGGHVGFRVELTGLAKPGASCRLTVRCRDDWWSPQPRGKQSTQVQNHACHYTRTTGIWQTVWLEPVPPAFLERPRITPNVGAGSVLIEQAVNGGRREMKIVATLNGTKVEAVVGADFTTTLTLPVSNPRLWQPGAPHLYDIELRLLDAAGQVLDTVETYAGLRSVTIEGNRFLINGQPMFQRLVLDQGYYPDGILTAPTDAALERDIKLALQAGFNGARLHQKVFEERFLYHADRLGYIVWGELPDWCHDLPTGLPERINASWLTEWLEAVARDYSHPCIIGWCPLNEQQTPDPVHQRQLNAVMAALFWATKAADRSRPVLDVSGWAHRVPETDVYDHHNYEQDPGKLAAAFAELPAKLPERLWPKGGLADLPYRGHPFFVSEFGGICWNPDAKPCDPSWGYGERPKTLAEFYERFEGLCGVLLRNPAMFGYCYTQLTDVYQEQNGIYTFTRQPKFDLARLAAAQRQPAAHEQS